MSDLKEKIKQLISDVEIDSGEDAGYVSLNRESVIEATDNIVTLFKIHAPERAVAFAKWTCRNGWLISRNSEKWFQMDRGYAVNWKTGAELYALFDEETKKK